MKRKYQEHMTHNTGKNQATKTYFENVHILDLAGNDYKVAIINKFKYFLKSMHKTLKENRRTMSHQRNDISIQAVIQMN